MSPYRFNPPVLPRLRGNKIRPRDMARTIIFVCNDCGKEIDCGEVNTTSGTRLMDCYKREHDARHEREQILKVRRSRRWKRSVLGRLFTYLRGLGRS